MVGVHPVKSLVEEKLSEFYPESEYEVFDLWRGYDVWDSLTEDPSLAGYACARIWNDFRDDDNELIRIENVTLDGPVNETLFLKHGNNTICWIKLLPLGELRHRRILEKESEKSKRIEAKRRKTKSGMFWAIIWIGGGLFLAKMTGAPFEQVPFIWNSEITTGHLVDVTEETTEDDNGRSVVQHTRIYEYTVNGITHQTGSTLGDLMETESIDYLPDNSSISRISGFRGYISWLFMDVVFHFLLLALPFCVGFLLFKSALSSLKCARDIDAGNQASEQASELGALLEDLSSDQDDEIQYESILTPPSPERVAELKSKRAAILSGLKLVPPEGKAHNKLLDELTDIDDELTSM